jgi:RecT family
MSEEQPPRPSVDPEVVPPPEGSPPKPKAEIIPIERGRGIALHNFDALQRFAEMVRASGMAPKNMSMAQIAVAIQVGMEVGLSPMAALRAIYVVNGLPALRGSAALGLIRSREDLCIFIKVWAESDQHGPVKGVCVSQRRGQDVEHDEYTREMAQRAGRWNRKTASGEATPWVTDPDQMLMWRAVGRHVSKWWSDLLYGFPIVEAMDEDGGGEVTAAPGAPPPPGLSARPASDPLLDQMRPPTGEAPAPPPASAPIPGGAPQVVGIEGQLRESIRRMQPTPASPPFPSHAEADAAIAAEDAKHEVDEKQKPLFEKPKPKKGA